MVDNAKHMWPSDLQYIYSHLKNLTPELGFATGARSFICLDVTDFGEFPK